MKVEWLNTLDELEELAEATRRPVEVNRREGWCAVRVPGVDFRARINTTTLWCECDLWTTQCVHDETGVCLTHPACRYCRDGEAS